MEGIRPDGAVEAWNRQGSSVVLGGFWDEPPLGFCLFTEAFTTIENTSK